MKKHGLENKHGIEIRNKLVSLINNYKISPENVENELNKLIIKKSNELESETINELYKLIGKNKHNSTFSKQLIL